MPPENPYAASQVVDQHDLVVEDLEAEVLASLDSIRRGAGLSLKATWLVLLCIVVVGLRFVLPELRAAVPTMINLLLGAGAVCFS